MATIRLTAEIKEDRRLEIVLPPEIPLGQAELTLSIEPMLDPPPERKFRLSEWAAKYAEDLGDEVKSTDVEGFTGRRF